jgi:DNA-binding Lrp family transcriptional regulator
MDDIDKKILNILQRNFPVEAEPFQPMAAEIGVGEEEVLERIAKLREEGIVRRIGAIFDPRRLGYASALCAARVPGGKIADFVAVVNANPGVTHHYRRDHEYNVWFTLISPSDEVLRKTIEEIKLETGISDILTMRAARVFKINASFEL